VDVNPEDGGFVEINGDAPCSYPDTVTVDEGDLVILEAIAAAGYHFTGWSGEPTIERNPVEIEVVRNIEITANFALDFIEFTSEDRVLNIIIPAETTALNGEDKPLTSVEFTVADTLPPVQQGSIIEPAYNLEPTGATFDPPVTLTWAYETADIPEGVAEEDLVIAYYDENGGEWVELEDSEVDPEQGIITVPIADLSTFAVLAPPAAPSSVVETTFTTSGFTISPGEVKPGEEVTISVLVTNESQTEGSQSITLKIDGTIAQTRDDVSLSADAFTVVTFKVVRNEAGTYLVELNGETGEFTVKEAASTPAPPSSTQETSSSGINWAIMAPILTAIFLAIFLPIRLKRRRDHFDW